MHIMVDLETMGTRANAPIIALGAVKFDALSILDTFYAVVSLTDVVSTGAVIDPSTVMWWMKQSEEARSAFDRPGKDLSVVLADFTKWVDPSIDGVWGNGASFDNTILAESYARIGAKAPWPFWKDRCYRTVKGMFPGIPLDTRAGTHHNALDDARTQAMHLIRINAAHGEFL